MKLLTLDVVVKLSRDKQAVSDHMKVDLVFCIAYQCSKIFCFSNLTLIYVTVEIFCYIVISKVPIGVDCTPTTNIIQLKFHCHLTVVHVPIFGFILL